MKTSSAPAGHDATGVIRIHAFVPLSYVNGPGPRAVLWTQGCGLACPGCFNPETHSTVGGTLTLVDDLLTVIATLNDRVEGITISGGEPFHQWKPLRLLLERLKCATSLGVLVFTGYSWREIQSWPAPQRETLQFIDLLIAGRYRVQQRVARSLIGSSNKTRHFLSSRYRRADLELSEAEIIIDANGDQIWTGIDPGQNTASSEASLQNQD